MAALTHSQGKAKRSRTTDFWVLFATISAASMAYVASTALNVSLPAIQRDLNARGADLLWISNAYVIVQASLLIVCGSLSDRHGRNRVCMIGILLFGIASLISGSATTTELLILARFGQGVGSAMLVVTSLAIVSSYFIDKSHGRAIGIWSAFTLLTSGTGPLIGGILTEMGLWRFVFYVHIPFGAAAAWILWRYVPESYDKTAQKKLRLFGSLLVILGLLGITYGFIEAPQLGFSHPQIWLSIVLGTLALLVFLWGEYRSHDPIMPLKLFKSRTFSGANLGIFLLYAALGPSLLYVPLNLIQVQGYSETFAGIALMPMTLLMLVFAAYIGGIVDKYGPRTSIVVGQLLLSVAYAMLASVGVTNGQDDYLRTFFLPICLAGIGLGISLAPLAVTVMGSVNESKAGIASGISNTVSRVGQVLSIAILGGFMLTLFTQNLLSNPMVKTLPEEIQGQLEVASVDQAETSIPATLTAQVQEEVLRAIQESYVTSNGVLWWIGAAISMLSAILSWFMIDNRQLVKRHEKVP